MLVSSTQNSGILKNYMFQNVEKIPHFPMTYNTFSEVKIFRYKQFSKFVAFKNPLFPKSYTPNVTPKLALSNDINTSYMHI
jgi:hypothetical protein